MSHGACAYKMSQWTACYVLDDIMHYACIHHLKYVNHAWLIKLRLAECMSLCFYTVSTPWFADSGSAPTNLGTGPYGCISIGKPDATCI